MFMRGLTLDADVVQPISRLAVSATRIDAIIFGVELFAVARPVVGHSGKLSLIEYAFVHTFKDIELVVLRLYLAAGDTVVRLFQNGAKVEEPMDSQHLTLRLGIALADALIASAIFQPLANNGQLRVS